MCFLNTLCACSAQPFVSVMTHALLCLTPRSLSVYPQCLCIPMVPVCVSLWSLSVYPHCLCISTVPVCVIPTVYVSSRSLSVYPHCLCIPTVLVCVSLQSLSVYGHCLCVPMIPVCVSPLSLCPHKARSAQGLNGDGHVWAALPCKRLFRAEGGGLKGFIFCPQRSLFCCFVLFSPPLRFVLCCSFRLRL